MGVRRLLVIGLALVMILAVSLPAVAEGKKNSPFKDLEDASWASLFVAEMAAKGLMKGTGDGKFEPQGAMTRAQAITVAIRLMGLEAQTEALAVTDASLPYSDRLAIADWAKPYVAMGVIKGILPQSEDGMLRPEEKATRLWMSLLLVRALGKEGLAQSKMGAALPFKDAHLLPPHLIGYVAVAVEQNLVTGYGDQTFRPNQPVTRAEAAALLSRTDDQMALLGLLRPGTLHGEIKAVNAAAGSLVLRVKDSDQQVVVAPDAVIIAGNQEATLATLPVGAKAQVVIGGAGKAVLVKLKESTEKAKSPEKSPSEKPSGEEELVATLVAFTPPVGTLAGQMLIQLPGGGERLLALAPEVSVFGASGSTIALSSLELGKLVKVKIIAGVVIRVVQKPEDNSAKESAKEELKGVIVALQQPTASALGSITVQTAAGLRSFTVAADALIKTKAGAQIPLASLSVGQSVEMKVVSGTATYIKLHD